MKPRGFLESFLRYSFYVGLGLLPFTFLCWLIGSSTFLQELGIFLILLFGFFSFSIVFGLLGGALNQERSRVFHFLKQDDFISEIQVELGSKKFTKVEGSGSSSFMLFKYRLQRVVVQLEGNSATVIGTSGIVDNFKLPSVLYTQALELIRQNKYEEAVRLLEEILRQKPRSIDVRDTLFETHEKMDGPDEDYLDAKPIPRKSMQLLWLDAPKVSQIATALQNETSVKVELGDREEHKVWKITREDLFPLIDVFVVASEALDAIEKDNFRQAVHLYKKALKMAPGCDLYLIGLGSAYGKLGDKEKAAQFIGRAARISSRAARIRQALLSAGGIGAEIPDVDEPEPEPVEDSQEKEARPQPVAVPTQVRMAKIQVNCPHCGEDTFAILPDSGTLRGDDPEIVCERCGKGFKFTRGMAYDPIGYVN